MSTYAISNALDKIARDFSRLVDAYERKDQATYNISLNTPDAIPEKLAEDIAAAIDRIQKRQHGAKPQRTD